MRNITFENLNIYIYIYFLGWIGLSGTALLDFDEVNVKPLIITFIIIIIVAIIVAIERVEGLAKWDS